MSASPSRSLFFFAAIIIKPLSRSSPIVLRNSTTRQAPNLTDPLPSPSKNSSDLHQSQEQPLAKVGPPVHPVATPLILGMDTAPSQPPFDFISTS